MAAVRLTADWLLSMDRPPLRAGALLIGADGRIAAVGADAEVPTPHSVPSVRFEGAALLPGLVNAHTHLELTGLDEQAPETDFPTWIRRIIALKASRTPAESLAAARKGIADGWAAGVTTVGDTGDSGAALEAMAELGASGTAYLEVFGPHPDDAPHQLAAFEARLDAMGRFITRRARLGVSPHAPYSVSGALYRAVAGLAARRGLPLAVHIAESEAEERFMADGGGAFAEAWHSRGIPLPPGGRTPIGWLAEHGVLGPRTLCIHAVRVSPGDLDAMAHAGSAVAHCPRSNRRHAGREAPLVALLNAGLRVGIGTDSVASVSPADLLAEAREARRLGGLTAESALALCTLESARALGMDAEVGSLSPGKWGDVAVLRLPRGVDAPDLADIVVQGGSAQVGATYLAGRPVYRAATHAPTAPAGRIPE